MPRPKTNPAPAAAQQAAATNGEKQERNPRIVIPLSKDDFAKLSEVAAAEVSAAIKKAGLEGLVNPDKKQLVNQYVTSLVRNVIEEEA